MALSEDEQRERRAGMRDVMLSAKFIEDLGKKEEVTAKKQEDAAVLQLSAARTQMLAASKPITVTIVVCLAIWGAAKYADFNQSGRGVAAAGALTVSIFGLVATFAIIALTIYLMIAAPE